MFGEIILDIGSRTKGYSIDSSDSDLLIITKSTEENFLKHIIDRRHLSNKNSKDALGNDVVRVDLFNALLGIYRGNYFYLGVFSEMRHFRDSNDPAKFYKDEFEFIKKLTRMRIACILKTMSRSYGDSMGPGCGPKILLAMLYNIGYIKHWLRYNDFPPVNRLPELLHEHKVLLQTYDLLMNQRENKLSSLPEQEQLVKLELKQLRNLVDQLSSPGEDYNILRVIVMYMLDKGQLKADLIDPNEQVAQETNI